jgi:hypothetical protein
MRRLARINQACISLRKIQFLREQSARLQAQTDESILNSALDSREDAVQELSNSLAEWADTLTTSKDPRFWGALGDSVCSNESFVASSQAACARAEETWLESCRHLYTAKSHALNVQKFHNSVRVKVARQLEDDRMETWRDQSRYTKLQPRTK